MSDDAIVYVLNLVLGVILAAVMTRHRQLGTAGGTLRHWILAAWFLAGADLLFVLRAELPSLMPRMVPTLGVTAGHMLLLRAARLAAGTKFSRWSAGGVVAFHLALLLLYASIPALAEWRSVTNGILWGGLSLITAGVLARGPEPMRRVMTIPAFIMAGQGGFHAIRTTLAVRAASGPGSGSSLLVQRLGDLEVSLFMVALFVSVLVAYLELSHAELKEAQAEVHALTSMLPICSWCNKVRDDTGYWRRIESFLRQKQIRVTHALCESCAAEHFADESGEVPALNTTG